MLATARPYCVNGGTRVQCRWLADLLSMERVRQTEQSMQRALERTRDVRPRRQPIALHAPATRRQCRLAVGFAVTSQHHGDDDLWVITGRRSTGGRRRQTANASSRTAACRPLATGLKIGPVGFLDSPPPLTTLLPTYTGLTAVHTTRRVRLQRVRTRRRT